MYKHTLNSCANVRSHECVFKTVMFEIIQTVVLKILYTKQTPPLIFWQALAIMLKNAEGSHTFQHLISHIQDWGLQNTLTKCLRGRPSLWILGNVPFSSSPVIGPGLHQSAQASNALGVSNNFNPPTEAAPRVLSFMLTHTGIIETRCSLCSMRCCLLSQIH